VIPSPSHRQMLIRAASQGVDVRILVPDENSDVPIARYAGQAYYEELLRRGVRIFEYQETMMHAKTFVADGQWSMIGSMNLDNRSIVLNDESNLLVLDETVGARMDSLFMADLERAEEVLLARFTARSWWARLRERGASLVATMM
jgi:cardiolipin synthase